MRRIAWWISMILVCSVLTAQTPGSYKGDWTGTGASGEILIVLGAAGEGKWNLRVTFTIGGNEVPTKVTTSRITSSQISAEYEFDLAGNKLKSELEGKIDGDSMQGDYKTKAIESGAQVDQGSWKAKRAVN